MNGTINVNLDLATTGLLPGYVWQWLVRPLTGAHRQEVVI